MKLLFFLHFIKVNTNFFFRIFLSFKHPPFFEYIVVQVYFLICDSLHFTTDVFLELVGGGGGGGNDDYVTLKTNIYFPLFPETYFSGSLAHAYQ